MAKAPLYNTDGQTIGEIELKESIFNVDPKPAVVHQVYLALEANAREAWADTKDKSEVRGGGKKPWKQKGTGRARHGSIRSPIWKGGGVTFGPLTIRNYTQKLNKKMKQAAVKMCLTDKIRNGQLIVLEELTANGKTKPMAELRQKLPGAGKSTLLVAPELNDMVNRATRNIQKLDMQQAVDVNVVDLLHHQYVITTKAAIDVLEKRFA